MAGSHTNNLPTPTGLDENPYATKNVILFWGGSKIGLRGTLGD